MLQMAVYSAGVARVGVTDRHASYLRPVRAVLGGTQRAFIVATPHRLNLHRRSVVVGVSHSHTHTGQGRRRRRVAGLVLCQHVEHDHAAYCLVVDRPQQPHRAGRGVDAEELAELGAGTRRQTIAHQSVGAVVGVGRPNGDQRRAVGRRVSVLAHLRLVDRPLEHRPMIVHVRHDQVDHERRRPSGRAVIDRDDQWLDAVTDHDDQWLDTVIDRDDQWLDTVIDHDDRRLDTVIDRDEQWLDTVIDHDDQWLDAVIDRDDRRLDAVTE